MAGITGVEPASIETFEEHPFLSKFKEVENIALALHFVQPQEYKKYFEDSANRAKEGVMQRSRIQGSKTLILRIASAWMGTNSGTFAA